MKNGHNNRVTKRSAMAALVISCMLACAFSPVISTLDEGESSVYAEGIDFNYVSLGDSMVNGFGFEDYYKYPDPANPNNRVNNFGFNVIAEEAYPNKLAEYLTDQGMDVNHTQLATSGLRTTELRYLIDPSFPGDAYTLYNNIYLDRCIANLGAGADIDKLREVYVNAISEADLITYQYDWDIGYTMGQSILSLVGMGNIIDFEFDLYIDSEILDTLSDIEAYLTDLIEGILAEQGIILDDYRDMIDMVRLMVDSALYSIVGYCANFNANMERIFELNPDAKVMVIDSYSNIGEVSLSIGDMTIPAGKIVDVVMDICNLYTKYLSPYSCVTYHVDIDDRITKFTDEYKDGVEISDDTKHMMEIIFGVPHGAYDLINRNQAIDALMNCVFNSETMPLDEALAGGIDIGAVETKLKSTVTMIGTTDCTVTMNEDGTCTVSNGTESVTFGKLELSLIWVYFTIMAEGGSMGHPNAAGHDIVYEALADEVIAALIEDAPALSNEMESDIPSTDAIQIESGEVGTLVGLIDHSAMGSYNVDDIAERLGLDVDDTILPLGVRVNDINYLLGGTEVLDVYGQSLMTDAAADYGVSIGEFRQMYQDAVIDSSAVVVAAGSNNINAAIAAGIAAITGGDGAMDLDFTDVGVDPVLVSAIQDIRATINEILVSIFGEGSEVVTTIENVMDFVDNVAYGIAGYMDNYGAMVEAIVALNPETKIIVLGPYNMLEGVVYDNGTIRIDIGAISGLLFEGINQYNFNQVPDVDNIIYGDLTNANADKPEFNIAGFDMETDMEALMEHMALDANIGVSLNEALGNMFADYQYSITFGMGSDPDVITYYNFDDVVTVPEDPVAEPGYHFAGWMGVVPETMPACNMFFAPNFEPNTYTIVFNGNGGEGEMDDMTATYDLPLDLDTNVFTLEGYVFAGWNTAADGSGTTYANGAEVMNLCVEDGAEITLYAMWNVAPADDVFGAPQFIATAAVFLVIVAFGAMLYARRN